MFRTELPLTPHPQQLPLSAQVLTVGSCFSDTIGSRLAATKVKTLVNPFGTVFNPLSACQLLRAAAGEDQNWQQHLVEARGRWQSYDLHASIGADSPVTLLQQIQELVRETGEFLHNTDVVLLTLGTAYAYRLLETDDVVNNCHKVPAERFEKVLLTPDEIINAVAETHAYLRRANPKLRFILTVSPVRHLKDTLPLNAVSKSVLRLACHYLSELLPDVSYFPAYELLLDDLRDYRFYASDMLHPSETAETYIWERFTRTYFDSSFGRFRREWESVRQALGHRPLYAEAPEHREFLVATLDRLDKLAAQADVRTEMQEVQRQLAALPLPKATPVPEPEPDDDEERIDIGEAADQPEAAATTAAPVAAAPVAISTPVAEPAAADDAEQDEDADEDEDDDLEEEALDSTSTGEAPLFPKKKRRSRGGAKRTARKKAAQLYAQQAAEAAAATVSEPVGSTAQEAMPSAAPSVTESAAVTAAAPLETPAQGAATPVAPPEPVAAPVIRPVAAIRTPAPQSRPEPKADWLQVMDDDSEEDMPIPVQPEPKAAARGKSSRAAVEKKPRVTKDRIITTPPSRANRKKPAPLYAAAPVETVAVPEPATPAETPVAAVVSEPVVTVAPAPVAPVEALVVPAPEAASVVVETNVPRAEDAPVRPVAAAKKPRAKPAAKPKPAAKAPVAAKPKAVKPKAAPVAEAQPPVAVPEVPEKPVAKPKAAKAKTPKPPASAPEAPKAEAPKKSSRPPRKKKAADETPSAS